MTDHIEPILRRPRVEEAIGLSLSTNYLRVSQGLFTQTVSLGPRRVGLPASEVSAINAARIAGQSDDEVRALVTQLNNARGATIARTA